MHTTNKRKKRIYGLALIDLLVVIVTLGLTLLLLLGGFAKDKRYLYIISCNCNLSQIGKSLIQYESPSYYNTHPQYFSDDKITPPNIESGARMYLLFKSGLLDNPALFHCKFARYYYPENITTPDFINNKNNLSDAEMKKMYLRTDYGLINGYKKKMPSNTVICADSPFSDTERDYSIHGPATALISGANCLYADGHSKTERSLAPQGSAQEEIKDPKSTIYTPKEGKLQIEACGVGTKEKATPASALEVEYIRIFAIIFGCIFLVTVYFLIKYLIKIKRKSGNTS